MRPGQFAAQIQRAAQRREAALRAQIEAELRAKLLAEPDPPALESQGEPAAVRVPLDAARKYPPRLFVSPDPRTRNSLVNSARDPDDEWLADCQADMREIERLLKRTNAGEHREEEQREVGAFADRVAEAIADRLERA